MVIPNSDEHAVPASGTGEGDLGGQFDDFYSELRALAGYHLASERRDHTLQPTALVHEVFLRLARQGNAPIADRTGFLAVASHVIRRILIDHARRVRSDKRGGKALRVSMEDLGLAGEDRVGTEDVDMIELDDALTELENLSPRQARVIELRYFCGLSISDAAGILGVSDGSVKGDWRHARAWLRMRLGR